MKRTTVMLPPELRTRAGRHAHKLGISLGELIRLSLDSFLRRPDNQPDEDPLFNDPAIFEGQTPKDASVRHDDHLYGDRK